MSDNKFFIHNKWEAMHIELIKETAAEIWGDDIVFGEIEDLGAPWAEFKWPVKIYSYRVDFVYDRSILDISIPTENSFCMLPNLTNEPIIEGFESTKPQNLYHNFKVLDRYLHQQMDEEE